MKGELLVGFVLCASCCWADADHIKELLLSTLSEPGNAAPLKPGEFQSVLQEEYGSLTPSDFRQILPIAMQCIRSRQPEPRNDGIAVLANVAWGANGSELLESYVDELGHILDEPQSSPIKGPIVVVLATCQPKPSPKAIAVLAAHLEDETANSPVIVRSLVANSSADSDMLRKVLRFVETHSDGNLSQDALQAMHYLTNLNEDALAFIRRSLNSTDRYTRASAIDLLAARNSGVLAEFVVILRHIAADPSETEDVRLRAKAALYKYKYWPELIF